MITRRRGQNTAVASPAGAVALQESLRKLHAVGSSRETFAKQAVRILARAANADAAALLACDYRASRVRLVGTTGAGPEVFKALLAQSGVWIVLRPLNERRINVIFKAEQNPFVPSNLVTAINPEGLAIAVVPFYRKNLPVGALVLFSSDQASLSEALLQTLAQALRVCAVALEDAFEVRGHMRSTAGVQSAPAAEPGEEEVLSPVENGPVPTNVQEMLDTERKRISELESELDRMRDVKDRLPALQAEVDRLDLEAQQARAAAEAARARAAKLEAERAEAENRAKTAADMLQALMEARDEQQRRIEETLRLSRIQVDAVADLDAQLRALSERAQRADEVEERLLDGERARAELEVQVRELSDEVRRSSVMESRLRDAEAIRSELEAQLNREREQMAELENSRAQAELQLREKIELLEAARAEALGVRADLDAVQEERDRLRSGHADLCSRVEVLSAERSRLHDALEVTQSKLAEKDQEAETQAALWAHRLTILEEERDRLKTEIVEATLIFEKSLVRIRARLEQKLHEQHESEKRLFHLAGMEPELESLRSQLSELQEQITTLRQAAANVSSMAAASETFLGVTPVQVPLSSGTDPDSGVIRVEAARLDSLLDTIGGIETHRARTHHELHTIAVLREQLNAWRTQFVERDRTEAGVETIDEHTFYRAFATQSAHIVKQLTRLIDVLGQQDSELAAVSLELQQKVDGLRLVPLDTVFRRLRRPVRDAARQEGKLAELNTEGGEIQVCRSLIEPLHAALLHVVRNAVAHGIEERQTRSAAGKPAQGTVKAVARVVREGLVIQQPEEAGLRLELYVSDDGAGLDLAAVLAKAKERGLLTGGQIPQDAQLAELIFAPGFSTARSVNGLAGRGVGMDVVRQEIAKLGGTVELQSQRGLGTTILIKIPVRSAIQ